MHRHNITLKYLIKNARLWVTSYSGMFWLDYLTFFGNDPRTSTECHLSFQTSHSRPRECRLCNLQSHSAHHNTITQLLTLSPYSSITLMPINNNDVLFFWKKKYILLFNNKVPKKILGLRKLRTKIFIKFHNASNFYSFRNIVNTVVPRGECWSGLPELPDHRGETLWYR